MPENPAAKGKSGRYRPAAATFREASENQLPKWDNIFRPQRASPDMAMPGLTNLRLPPPVYDAEFLWLTCRFTWRDVFALAGAD